VAIISADAHENGTLAQNLKCVKHHHNIIRPHHTSDKTCLGTYIYHIRDGVMRCDEV